MELITNQILKTSFTLTINDITYDHPYIVKQIAKAKTFLINTKNCRPGQKVLLTAQWPEYLIWFFAGAELGLSFVVADLDSRSCNTILKLYDSIDIELTDNIDIGSQLAESNEVWATEDSVLIYTTSSGSTSNPKVVTYTHSFLFKLMERNASVYGIQDNDRCVHTKTLTHSSIVGIYFLPTLYACSNHYFFNHKFSHQLRKYKITKCAVLREHLKLIYNEFDNDIDYDFTIYVITRLLSDYKIKLVNEHVKLISVFGTSETMGPLFLSEVNNTNKTQHDNNNFGRLLDDFYKIKLSTDYQLTVIMPDGTEIITGDSFHIRDGNFIFSRNEQYVINNEPIHLNVFRINLSKLLPVDFDLIADEETNQIYIRLENSINLDNLNTLLFQTYNDAKYYISKQILGTREEFTNDVKLDANLIRIKCREYN